jgi:hypothetical protein
MHNGSYTCRLIIPTSITPIVYPFLHAGSWVTLASVELSFVKYTINPSSQRRITKVVQITDVMRPKEMIVCRIVVTTAGSLF